MIAFADSLPPQDRAAIAAPLLPPALLTEAFRQAIARAADYAGATAPNPPVGCAILDTRGDILACAAHPRSGAPHAEALALAACEAAGLTARIHTLLVTLEPCNHTGRTPPCTEAILRSPAREIWIGAADPNPKVCGGGAERLREAGLAVHHLADLPGPKTPTLLAECRRMIAPFAKWAQSGLPWVTIKQALDANGAMIPPNGRKTFTSDASLIFAHQLRRRADAILTGSGTILADTPELTVRHVLDHPDNRRWLVIMDRRGRVPASYISAAEARGFDVRIEHDVNAALQLLGHHGALEVLVEAGPLLLENILSAPIWDEHIIIRKSAVSGEPDQITTLYRKDLP